MSRAQYSSAYTPDLNYTPTTPSQVAFHADSGDGTTVEIPRFKKRDLNLAIVSGRWDVVLYVLFWIICLCHGLLSVFFDVNVMYVLVQVAGTSHLWIFASAGYGACVVISVGIWLWEVCYGFWRRWDRRYPAIEPIYFSLAASTHLALISFIHFVFLLHIRLSALRSSYFSDILPEGAYLVVQLTPGALPLVVRACLAGVLLISFWNGGGSAGGDPTFFTGDQLSTYAKGVLIAFIGWTALRVALIVIASLVLWLFSFNPFAKFCSWSPSVCSDKVDPAVCATPAKTWRDEDELQWAWRERARARIQNAFELCLVRRCNYLYDLAERNAQEGIQQVRRENVSTQRPSSPAESQSIPSIPSIPSYVVHVGARENESSALYQPVIVQACPASPPTCAPMSPASLPSPSDPLPTTPYDRFQRVDKLDEKRGSGCSAEWHKWDDHCSDEFEFDCTSYVSPTTNDDLISLEHFLERDGTPYTGALALIRFQALSREGDNTFENGGHWTRYSPHSSLSAHSRISAVSARTALHNSVSPMSEFGVLPPTFPKLPSLPSSGSSTRSRPPNITLPPAFPLRIDIVAEGTAALDTPRDSLMHEQLRPPRRLYRKPVPPPPSDTTRSS